MSDIYSSRLECYKKYYEVFNKLESKYNHTIINNDIFKEDRVIIKSLPETDDLLELSDDIIVIVGYEYSLFEDIIFDIKAENFKKYLEYSMDKYFSSRVKEISGIEFKIEDKEEYKDMVTDFNKIRKELMEDRIEEEILSNISEEILIIEDELDNYGITFTDTEEENDNEEEISLEEDNEDIEINILINSIKEDNENL